jgi:glycosidase
MIEDISKLAIYEVYLRNHSKSGTFADLIEDLDRIQAMGIDMIWLMPIHPIGSVGRKGSLGSPYAVKDHRAVNPEYGTMDGFLQLLHEIHNRDMKCMLDVVFHHTSKDSTLLQSHPEYFHKNDKGEFVNRIAGWSDVHDLNYANKDLWDVQIDNLKFWTQMGVDGFRCDVASMVPIDFWQCAVDELKTINRDLIWLAETLTPQFLQEVQRKGIEAHDDEAMYRAFDITYDYDAFAVFASYTEGNATLDEFVDALIRQNDKYDEQQAKLRFVENHDCMRVRKRFSDPLDVKMWTAFIFFLKGPILIYAGQETCDTHTPSLFEKDPVQWEQMDDEMAAYLRRMVAVKKIYMPARCKTEILKAGSAVMIRHKGIDRELIGIFNIEKKSGSVDLGIEDKIYTDLNSDEIVEVKEGAIQIEDAPIIIFVQSS